MVATRNYIPQTWKDIGKMMLAIRNYTPPTIHGHKSHPNNKLFL